MSTGRGYKNHVICKQCCACAIKLLDKIGSHEEEEGREFWAVSVVGLLALLIPSSTLFTSWERRGEERREREGGERYREKRDVEY